MSSQGSSSAYRTYFNITWLDPEFSPWLKEAKNKENAACSMCKKEFLLSNMGIRAIKSHVES